MLTKYLMGKPTRLWDEYLTKALFATRVREHTVTRKSPYFLVYGVQPRIVTDEDSPVADQAKTDRDEQIQQLADARSKANELLLVHAVKKQKIRDLAVTKTSFKPDDWVLVRNESKKKFESTWFGPYKVVQSHPLGIYALAEPSGRVLRNLINGARLTDVNVGEDPSLWASPAGRSALRKTRAAARKRRKRETVNKAPEQGPPGADEWDSEANDYESEDSQPHKSEGYESAEDAHQEPE
ncbi:hypothetical protein ACN38_g13208 [Penicillium nordicum]|uniref:Integrase catalytic domain-containing protein n=1 Tax=Penicillium nordicum TaxID=229535 RepID=A0A0M9W9B7_9EURO|nr:hypothetical protein ACN38_g13208 [Penicillium nordicum]